MSQIYYLGPGTRLNSVLYNTVLDSILYVKITVSNTVLGSIVYVKNKVLGSTACAIIHYLLIKNAIAPVPNSKAWCKNTVLRSTGNYVGNF